MSQPELIPAEAPKVMELQTRQEPTPMLLLQLAMDQGADLDKLTKLMELQERWEATEARKAFVRAMAAFKAAHITISKNKQVSFTTSKGTTQYKHATLDNVVNVLGEELSKHGLSFRWHPEQANGRIRVTCFLQHEQGHTESVTMEGPADDSGNKNSIQQVGSTVTYLERYTLLAITGTATADQDSDGVGGVTAQDMDEGDFQSHLQKIRQAPDLPALSAAFNEAMGKTKDQGTKGALINAKNDRQNEIKRGGK